MKATLVGSTKNLRYTCLETKWTSAYSPLVIEGALDASLRPPGVLTEGETQLAREASMAATLTIKQEQLSEEVTSEEGVEFLGIVADNPREGSSLPEEGEVVAR